MGREAILRSVALLSVSAVACSGPLQREAGEVGRVSEPITSRAAKIVDFTFAAEVLATDGADARAAVVSQLMFVQGILMSAGNGNAHIGNVSLSNVDAHRSDGKQRITYEATLPVAWPKDASVPSSYELALPRDATAFEAFAAKYAGPCGDNGHGPEAFWFDFDPKASGCALDAEDVAKVSATVAPSAQETTHRYPEYDLVWADARLDVVAIFSIITEDTPRDWGYHEAKRFLDGVRERLGGARMTERDASSSVLKHQTLTGAVRVGGRERPVHVDVLVVPDLARAGEDFDARYDPLSERADLILYNGHAGLGSAVNALAHKGRVAAGKYQLVLLGGCQTFAYVDTTMADRRRAANGEADPRGTRFLDVVGNALPNPVDELARVSNALVGAMIDADQPKSYGALLDAMPEAQIVVVFGEEDNRFTPR